MDPQTVPLGNGEFMHIWEFNTYVEDTNEFTERYMAYSLEILTQEPINIFGWPLFLPVCIARDYYTLWTRERMQQLISAARLRNIAFEINDMSHTPHEEFIRMATSAGPYGRGAAPPVVVDVNPRAALLTSGSALCFPRKSALPAP